MDDTKGPDESLRTDMVLEYVERVQDAHCNTCGAGVCGHEAVICLAMGFKNSPLCLSCLAAGLAQERDGLRDHVFAYVDHHECLRAGWDWASRHEGFDPVSLPACLWAESEEGTGMTDIKENPPGRISRQSPADAEWDAGDMGCGDLVLQLRMRLQSMKPGEVLKVTARDPGAPEDLPAWCRLTGHTLLSSHHPDYWIQRKEG